MSISTDHSADESNRARTHANAGTPLLHGVNILVVEDHEDSRVVLTAILEHWGMAVRAAGSFQEALSSLERNPPQLLLSDLGLPDGDGFQLVKRVRAQQLESGGPFLPALAVSAMMGPEVRRRALAAGFQACLPKPLDLDRLEAMLGELLPPVKALGALDPAK